MKSTTRKISSIQAAAKAIMSNSATTVSGGDAGKQRKTEKTSKRMNALETTSTAFSDSDKYSSNERLDRKVENIMVSPTDQPFMTLNTSQDVEMEFDSDHSFDSPMGLEDESVNSKVVSTYGAKLLQNLINKQTKLSGDFGKHEIKSSHRKQMIIWMDEVLTIFR